MKPQKNMKDQQIMHVSSKNIFIENSWTVKTYHTGMAPFGHYSFPFSIELPDWLPSSVAHTDNNTK